MSERIVKVRTRVRCWSCAERPDSVRRGADVAPLFIARIPVDSREHFALLLLDARHAPMAAPLIVSTGTLNASLVHPREVFAPAIRAKAAAIIVGHNHPSGDVTPSMDDRELTVRLDAAGELMGVALLDHIIIAHGDIHGRIDPGAWLSMRESGWPERPRSFPFTA